MALISGSLNSLKEHKSSPMIDINILFKIVSTGHFKMLLTLIIASLILEIAFCHFRIYGEKVHFSKNRKKIPKI